MALRIILTCLSIFLIAQGIYGKESGFNYYRNYTYKEYDNPPQNWQITQADNGLIYVANQGGVLEFDGETWRIIKVPDYAPVRSLAIHQSGTIYVGGKQRIGYLKRAPNGFWQYVSLLDHLTADQKKFSNVWRTHATSEGVYFRTSNLLFRWRANKMKVWSNASFRSSFVCNGTFYVQKKGVGLMKVVEDSLTLIPGGETFANEKIWMMTPYGGNGDNPGGTHAQRLLMGTRGKGFFLYDGKSVTAFPTQLDDYLTQNRLYNGIRLSRDRFALVTLKGGLVIMDADGALKRIFDKTTGLQDNDVKNVFQDTHGNLWMALGNGLSKIEYASPFSHYNDRSRLRGLVLTVTRENEDLYVGTSTGLYVLRPPAGHFQRIPGMINSCWDLRTIGQTVLAATTTGVFRVEADTPNSPSPVIKGKSFVLCPSQKSPGLVWCGTGKGLFALTRKQGQWLVSQPVPAVKHEIRHIAEDADGHLWLVTSTGDVLKVNVSVSPKSPTVTWYETSHGLPEGNVYPTMAAGHVMFATPKGIYRFDPRKDAFAPDPSIARQFADGSRPVFRIIQDQTKNIWIHSRSRNYLAVPGKGNPFDIQAGIFRRIPTTQVNAIYPEPNKNAVWFASSDGLIRYDPTVKKDWRRPFPALIRKVLVNGKPIFSGAQAGLPPPPSPPVLASNDRSIHIEFAAPFFEAESKTTYQCLLEGYDQQWTPWSRETWKDYTNLDSGLNTFRVRAQNVYGVLSDEAVFQFSVTPPWYKSWWAVILYIAAAFIAVYLLVKWRSLKLVKEKQRLEQIVMERTMEISQKNRQLQEQSRKLREMDDVKSRFFANISHEFRTPLTLIMSPLEKMIDATPDREKVNQFKMMLRSSQRLLRLINRLLDLSKLDSGRMKIDLRVKNIIPTIKVIVSTFEALAAQNQIQLALDLPEDEAPLAFDAEKLEEILCNLLINAIKFTPARGTITISTRRESTESRAFPKGYLELSVRDTGVGIPRDKLGHIFDRFYQTGENGPSKLKGSGIGLALTKELVLMHHGKIDVHSREGDAGGTEFVIRLPLGDRPPTASPKEAGDDAAFLGKALHDIEALDIEAPDIVENGENGENDENRENEENQKPGTPEQNGETRAKNIVLVVEDNADVRKYICDPLTPQYTVVQAQNGREGIDKAKELIPDLIVSDIMMPEVDGYQLCDTLKKDVKTSHIPIILLTAKASAQSVIQGLETGADDYITKPFNTKILTTRIKNLIQLRLHLQQKVQKKMLLQPAEIAVSSVDQKFIAELQEVIQKHISETDFNVDALSKKMFMNRVTLYRKVNALTGESPTQFIRSYRLKQAAQLLKDNMGNVSEVALEVGFSNLGYFSRCFKEKFHQLPSSYQAANAK